MILTYELDGIDSTEAAQLATGRNPLWRFFFSTVERLWLVYDSQGQILALAFKLQAKVFKTF